MSNTSGSPFILGSEVTRALHTRSAVVALETTVVTHGLPPPAGVATALELETIVRHEGAIPATIGVLDGAIRVGLTPAEIERLAQSADVAKVNLSNLAAIISSARVGSTTVAATMLAAHACGIHVFATGGIGGVHREAGETGDVSADLTALSRIPLAVVSAGAKAVLDLPRTLEMLETLGVPVFGLGTEDFPAFYRRASGLQVDAHFDRVEDLAAAVRMHFNLGWPTGVLVANPIPAEHELPRNMYDRALSEALSELTTRGITGRSVTPFLLERMRELTAGESVRANIALLRNNAKVAARLALALAAPVTHS